MARTFHNLKSRDIECIGWWFWYRETWTVTRISFKETVKDFWNSMPPPWAFGTWFEFFVGFPLACIFLLFAGSYLGRRHARNAIRAQVGLDIYNQKNIDYFTIIESLSGYTGGYQ